MHYIHSQFGTVMVIGLLTPLVLVSFLALYFETFPWVPPLALLILLVSLALFYSLTIEIDSGVLTCRFGIGVIRKRIPLADIQEVRAVTNPWFAGWGIRWMPGYWLWNVAGLKAVELTFGDGSRFRIGTDEPEVLVKAIEVSKASTA